MIFKQFKRIICILVGLIYLYSIVTHKDKYTYKKDMQKAEPGMGFITCKVFMSCSDFDVWNCVELYGTV